MPDNQASAPAAPSPARVRALLAALGDTPEAVAATLLAGGYRGDPGSACGCPVAKYLEAEGLEGVLVYGQVRWNGSGWLDLPDPVLSFTSRFDGDADYPDTDGEWPELRLACSETSAPEVP